MPAGDPYWDGYFSLTEAPPPRDMYAWFLDRWPCEQGALLDFGAGTGRFAEVFFKERPMLAVDAMDGSPNALAFLQARAGLRRVWTQPFEAFSVAEAYHAIWAMNVLFFVERAALPALFASLNKALLTEGVLAFTFLEEDPAYPVFLDLVRTRVTESELRDLLKAAGFTVRFLDRKIGKYGAQGADQPFFRVLAEKV
ncbi:MAG: class I SAM-dependent methyltransferase [Alphaproteobacteria bacterium]|nr:class I SAM-dependent methyltransferase [Alphaproteobacteria bacterium]